MAAPESPAVPSNSAVAIPKVVFSAISSAFRSGPVKYRSGDPALIRRALAGGPYCIFHELKCETLVDVAFKMNNWLIFGFLGAGLGAHRSRRMRTTRM